jgi:hypothetical protein
MDIKLNVGHVRHWNKKLNSGSQISVTYYNLVNTFREAILCKGITSCSMEGGSLIT